VKKKIILGVAAHPDDLDFIASGTVAKWIKQGTIGYYLICTNGCKGSDDPKMTEAKLIKIRRREQIQAGRIIGLKDVFFLNHNDTELVDDLKLKKEIVYYIRKLKPEIVITTDPTFVYSPYGFINHTDHRAAGQAAIDAVFPLSRDRLTFPEHEKQGLMPHKVKTLYLPNFDNSREIIDISDTIDIKLKALAAHKSQIDSATVKWVKERSGQIGKKLGYDFAESFIKLNLMP
jgi:LmbE family N-acetylglucosaminyl deacetylase